MKTIQKWFEQLAGISPDELDRIALAAKIFAEPAGMDISDLKTPACWRRNSKVRRTRA
jgi:hypothetical protein